MVAFVAKCNCELAIRDDLELMCAKMKINYFDDSVVEDAAVFIFLGKSGAGVRDLRRISKLFPKSQCLAKSELGWWKTISGCKLVSSVIYIHSSPWNLLHRCITLFKRHYLIVHNPPNFISRNGIKGWLDRFIFILHMLQFNELIFLSKHVMDEYKTKKNIFLLSKRPYVEYKKGQIHQKISQAYSFLVDIYHIKT
jgi:hypothetical protein